MEVKHTQTSSYGDVDLGNDFPFPNLRHTVNKPEPHQADNQIRHVMNSSILWDYALPINFIDGVHEKNECSKVFAQQLYTFMDNW